MIVKSEINNKPCIYCGTTDLKKKLPQEYEEDGQPCWDEACFKCYTDRFPNSKR